jgi:hypothetical protein
MEGWALPAESATALAALEAEVGEDRLHGLDGSLIRGTHWRNFLVKYPEANRLHKKMLALSALCRERGDPPEARRAIGRAQCNDAYWHGVFGGLYLPFLRGALWQELARAERLLRKGEPLVAERLDLDFDGAEEIWVHDDTVSVVISPARGGAIEEYTDLALGINHAAVLTRRREAYHLEALAAAAREKEAQTLGNDEGAASIHDIEASLRLDVLPPVDALPRSLGVDRLIAADWSAESFISGAFDPVHTCQGADPLIHVDQRPERVEVVLAWPDLTKRIIVAAGGALEVQWTWDPAAWPAEQRLTSEWSIFAPLVLDSDSAERWDYDVETVAKSERGLDRTVQGQAVVFVWPVGAGRAVVRVPSRV